MLKVIEEYTGEEIERYDISKGDYSRILDDSDDGSNNWQALLKDANEHDGTGDTW